MTPYTLLRWSGLAAIVAGTLEALNAVMDFLLFPPRQSLVHASVMSFSQQAVTNAWAIQQTVNWVAKVFLLWALVGLYSRQSNEAGVLGFIAFLLSFVGIALVFGAIFGYFLLAPDLARVAPAFLDGGPTQLSLVGLLAFILPFLVAQVGILLFGVASWRAKVFPRWAAALFILTPLLFVVDSFINLPFIADIAFGVGLVWMGYTLWAEQRQVARQRAVAAVS
jgi:hypothetical protein